MKEDQSKYLCPYCADTLDSYENLKSHVLQSHRGEPDPYRKG